MYKVSPSLLDSYRSVLGLTQFEKSPDELIEQIKGVKFTSHAMQFGTDVHEFIEKGESDKLFEEEKQQLIDFSNIFKFAVKEYKVRSQLTDEITLSLIADALTGNIGHEFKTSKNWYGPDYYTDSYQPRIYAHVYDLDCVVFHHFQYTSLEKRPVTFKYRSFMFYPYEGMDQDIINLAESFISWCISVGVDNYLKFNK